MDRGTFSLTSSNLRESVSDAFFFYHSYPRGIPIRSVFFSSTTIKLGVLLLGSILILFVSGVLLQARKLF
jgi:hypothetical protein